MKLSIKKFFRINGLLNRIAAVYFLFEENIL
jgi:hypothetical protein